jgi:hypothetical protein
MNEGHYAGGSPKLTASPKLDPGARTLLNRATSDGASSQATISTVMFVDSGVQRAGGGVLYFTAPRGTHVSLGGPGLAGVIVGGAF